jgi:hypothetical protein
LCLPRFRGPDCFARSKLCIDCKDLLGKSGLLFGRWSLLTKSEELYPYNSKRLETGTHMPPLCHLCILMANEFERMLKITGSREFRSGYGTFSWQPIQPITCETANAMIRIRTEKWGLKSLDYTADCYVQMLAADDRKSREFAVEIRKGMITTHSINIGSLSLIISIARALDKREEFFSSTGSESVIAIAKQ